MRHAGTISEEWGFGKIARPGYRALFSGPPGTGKTLAATLIGQRLGLPVYRVDLHLVVSKYIGETEKNLARLLDRARKESWILLFDEADALFGKRTDVADADDRYANQEVSYLLQRLESYEGLVILTSNLEGNFDPVLVRRFQSVVSFPLPSADLRLRLWRGVLSDKGRLAADVDLEALARSHELSGGAIVDAARYGAVRALDSGAGRVAHEALVEGVRRELQRAGRAV
jgi:SpoVK/Ycf46/Vps4 family AAA+-type ATPase